MTEVSVIIPHYNDLAGLKLCLDALGRQTMKRERFDIVIADNGSPFSASDIEAVVRDRARVVVETTPGAGPARNAAVAASQGSILAFTDADCVPAPGWLEAGVAALRCHPLVGGRMTVLVRDLSNRSAAEAFETVFAFDNERYVDQLHFSVTANLFCSRETFDAVGPFRTGMSEDLEWCLRARDAGFAIGYAADAEVGHPARTNWQQLTAKWRRIQAETFALRPRSPINTLTWLARAWAMPLSIVAHVPKVARAANLSPIEKLRAVGCLARLRLWRMADAHRLALGLKR